MNANKLAPKFCYEVAKIPCYILSTGSVATLLPPGEKLMFRNKGSLALSAALVGLLSAFAAAPTMAQTATVPSVAATGLGQSWPNAADLSASPHYHVYVFFLHGVKYVQVNDLNGTVHAAVGVASNTVFALPVGVDAANVTTTPATAAATSATETVYSDATTTVTATPQSNGTTTYSAQAICSDPYTCSGPGIASH